MVNMNIPYRGPDGLSAQLFAEVQQRFGARAQNLGYITGYPEAARAGQTGGHFPDAHGITHAVDIGVDIQADGTGLDTRDALWLAHHLRALGAAGKHPFSQRGYLIHDMSETTTPRPLIAGFHTGWKWVAYTGASPHSDHIHVTTGGDQQWGEAPQLAPAVYDSRASWGVGAATVAPQSTTGGMSPVPTGTKITQEFGQFPGGYNPTGGHTGRDWGTWSDTPAVAPADGVVIYADWCHKLPGGTYGWAERRFFDLAFGGILVGLDHGTYESWFSHMNATHLNPGDRVTRGQIIGRTGNTGAATSGPHLHFEIIPKNPNWNNGTYGRIHPGPYVTGAHTTITTSAGTAVATPGRSTGSGAAPTTIDPLEQIMAWYSSKKEFERAVGLSVIDFKFSDNGRGPTGKKEWIHLGKVLSGWNEFVGRIIALENAVANIPAATHGYDVTRRGEGPASGKNVNLATVLAFEQDNQIKDRAVAQQILDQQALIMRHLGIDPTPTTGA